MTNILLLRHSSTKKDAVFLHDPHKNNLHVVASLPPPRNTDVQVIKSSGESCAYLSHARRGPACCITKNLAKKPAKNASLGLYIHNRPPPVRPAPVMNCEFLHKICKILRAVCLIIYDLISEATDWAYILKLLLGSEYILNDLFIKQKFSIFWILVSTLNLELYNV
jgi:hypothetical protein